MNQENKACRTAGSIKALEELREWIDGRDGMGIAPLMVRRAHKIADAVESEIAERFMELPVDADGVPVRIGDMLLKSTGAQKASYGEVVGVSDDSVWFDAKNGWECNWAHLTRRVQQDAVESLLDQFQTHITDDTPVCELQELIVEYAERIRKAVEHEG